MNAIIEGVGPDAPIAVNANGAKQSASPYRMDLVPARAILRVAKVLKHGAEKYGEGNWLGLSKEEIINHALVHAYADLAGDMSEADRLEHLAHTACRALMALEVALRAEEAAAKVAA